MKGNFYENERVALFIDGANLYSAARALGFDIDYRRLLKVFREKGRLVRAYYYTALVEDQVFVVHGQAPDCWPCAPSVSPGSRRPSHLPRTLRYG